MAGRLTLSGVDWEEHLARHRRNVEALKKANERAFESAHAGIQDVLSEVSRRIERCRDFEHKSRAFDRAMADLGRAHDALKAEADVVPDGFLAAVSHKLLSPFTSLCSFSEILGDNPELPLEQRNAFLEIAIKESARLTRMIEQVLALGRMRAGRMDWRFDDVELGAAVADAVVATEPLFRDKVVRLDVEVPETLPTVRADRGWLAEVIRQLLSNAAKFSEPGTGRVDLAAFATGRMIELGVTDAGPGIAPERQRIIFAQFLEHEDTLNDEPHGVGLGLALSKEIVERHGGRIWVESDAGAGARFALSLPHGASTDAG